MRVGSWLAKTGIVLGMMIWAPLSTAANIRGELDLQSGYATNTSDSLDAALGERNRWDQDFRLRLMGSKTLAAGWGVNIDYLVEARQGGDVALKRKQYADAPAFYVDPQRRTLLRLNHAITDSRQRFLAHRLDRLALTYSGSNLVLRIGRQALTWGSGLVFHPMDLFNPFPPNATDTRYKPGADMLYGQWLFNNGDDIQMVAVPRRDPASGSVNTRQSASGFKWHGFAGKGEPLGIDLLLARNYQADIIGLGLGGRLKGASWSIEAVPTHLESSVWETSLLFNFQYAWAWAGKNINGFFELFHNGFGVNGKGNTLDSLPMPLVERFARGELFTVSKNYLALGASIQWTPRITLKPSVITNLNDSSVLLIGQAEYSLTQNTSLTAGFQWGGGGGRAEYGGGLETGEDSEVFVRSPNQVFARFTRYF